MKPRSIPFTLAYGNHSCTRRLAIVAVLLVNFATACVLIAAEPEFSVPKTVLVGDPMSIRLSGLQPRSLVRLSATRIYGRETPRNHASQAVFLSDDSGCIDTTLDRPVGGHDNSYTGIEPLGLLWSMKPTSEEASPKPEKDIVQWSAHEVSGEPSGVATEIASATTEIFRQVGDLEESALSKDEELQGAFVLRGKGDEKLPVIILLGGSEGGDWSARASAPGLASRGFAAVGVPYYSPAYNDAKPQFDRLPTAFINIPVDRLEAVRDAIEARVDLDADRIGIIGVSKGAEFALLAGSHFDWISAVCAIVPSDVVWEGWGDSHSGPRSCFSLNGKPLPFVPYEGMQTAIDKLRAGEPTTIREPHDAGRIKYAERVPDARIRVEEIRSAVMLVGGDQDETWNSGEMSRNIVETRLEAGLKTEAWISPLAGHYLSGHAFRPLKAAEGSLRSRTYPAMLDFFQRNLRSASND